jgi:hypothetical protein
VCKFSFLWQAVHAASVFDVYPVVVVVIFCNFSQVVLVDYFVWDVGHAESHVLVLLHWGSEVDIFLVNAHIFWM